MHTGACARVTLNPAAPGEGISFVRSDLPGWRTIPARTAYVTRTARCTVLAHRDAEVSTVEHLLAALWAMGIDNATIEVDGPEIPILDGSALPFVRAIEQVGTIAQDRPSPRLAVSLPRWVQHRRAWLIALPAAEFWVSAVYEHPHPAVGRQEATFPVTPEVFAREIAPARTFGYLAEEAELRERGLARGASLENALVIGESGYLAPLRFPNELARHKLLDLLGDLALLGARPSMHVMAVRAGHGTHHRLAEELAAGRLGFITEVVSGA